MLNTLLSDVEPWPWSRVNGAIRATQIAYILNFFGCEPFYIRNTLYPFKNYIAMSFSGEVDVDGYIDSVITSASGLSFGLR
jgi:hypothetical protein